MDMRYSEGKARETPESLVRAVENKTLKVLNVSYRLERRKHGGKLN